MFPALTALFALQLAAVPRQPVASSRSGHYNPQAEQELLEMAISNAPGWDYRRSNWRTGWLGPPAATLPKWLLKGSCRTSFPENPVLISGSPQSPACIWSEREKMWPSPEILGRLMPP